MNKPKLFFKRRDVREHFGVTNYRVTALIADGILPEPVRTKGRTPYWTRQMVEIVENNLREKYTPKPVKTGTIRPLSEKDRAAIRMSLIQNP
jgi:hypothetical protein